MANPDEVPSTSKQAVREQMNPDQLQVELRKFSKEITESIKQSSIEMMLIDFNEFLDVYKLFEDRANEEIKKGNESSKQYYAHNKAIVEGWVENIRMLVELEAEKRKREEKREVMKKEDAEREVQRQDALIKEAARREEVEVEELKRKKAFKGEKTTTPMDVDENTMTSLGSDFHGFESSDLGNAFTQFLEMFRAKGVEGAHNKDKQGVEKLTVIPEIPEIQVEVSQQGKPSENEQMGISFYEEMESPTAQNKKHDGLNFDYSIIDKQQSNANHNAKQGVSAPAGQSISVRRPSTINSLPVHSTVNTPMHTMANAPAHSTSNNPIHSMTSITPQSFVNVPLHQNAYATMGPNPNVTVHPMASASVPVAQIPSAQNTTVPIYSNVNTPMNQSAYTSFGPGQGVPIGTNGYGSNIPRLYISGYSNSLPIYSYANMPGPPSMTPNMHGPSGINPSMPGSSGIDSNIPEPSYVNIPSGQYGMHPQRAPYVPGNGLGGQDQNYSIEMSPAILNSRIEVPTFDGRRGEDWLPFFSTFNQFIHCNNKINEITKLSLLKTKLTGRALEVVKGYPLMPGNYAHAWMAVLSRYHKRDQLESSLIGRVDDLQPLRKHDYRRLEEMVNTTNQMMLSLPEIGVDVTNCDAFIRHMLFKKFDEDMKLQWRQHAGDREGVPVKEVLRFLEWKLVLMNMPQQAYPPYQIYQNNRMAKNYPSNQGNQGRAQVVHQVVEKKTRKTHQCHYCRENHPIYECPQLTKLRASERSKVIQDSKMCIICFGKQHKKQPCQGSCYHCKGPHNLFLCYKRENEFIARKREEEAKRLASVNQA